MRLGALLGDRAKQRAFSLVVIGLQKPAHHLEAQEEQERVCDIHLAVVANRLDLTFCVVRPDFSAAHALLAREARQPGHIVQRREVSRIEHCELIHEIQVASLVAVDIIVVAKALVFVAGFPETGAADPVHQGPVIEHRDIETLPVP